MENPLFFTKFWGWYLIIFFFILSFNPKRIKQIFNNLKDEKFLILAAFICITLGLTTVISHNYWELNYKLVITLIGWSFLFSGLALFIFPNKTVSWLILTNVKMVQLIYMLLFLIGLFLLNIVYQIIPY